MEMNVCMKQRILFKDIFISISIFLIVFGHNNISPDMMKSIYAFHLFLFCLMSGWYYKQKPMHDECRRYLIPYLVYTATWVLFGFVIDSLLTVRNVGYLDLAERCGFLLNAFITILFGSDRMFGVHLGPAWFLMLLFTHRLMIRAYKKMNIPIIWKVFLLIGVSYISMRVGGQVKLPFSLLPAFVSFPFFLLGYYCGKAFDLECRIQLGWSVLLVLISLLLMVVFQSQIAGTLLLISNTYPNNYFVTMLGGIIGCSLVVGVSKLLERISALRKTFENIGSMSMGIMGLHSIVRVLGNIALKAAGITVINVYAILVLAAIQLALCIPVCRLLKRKYPYLS